MKGGFVECLLITIGCETDLFLRLQPCSICFLMGGIDETDMLYYIGSGCFTDIKR